VIEVYLNVIHIEFLFEDDIEKVYQVVHVMIYVDWMLSLQEIDLVMREGEGWVRKKSSNDMSLATLHPIITYLMFDGSLAIGFWFGCPGDSRG